MEKLILADGVREVGVLPDFSVRYGRAMNNLGGCENKRAVLI